MEGDGADGSPPQKRRRNVAQGMHDGMDKVTVDAITSCDAIDAAYFETYDSAFIHEEMLRDSVRCKAYRDAIASCRSLIAGGIVIDVGAGCGILSCLCARAGARKVFAVEASSPTASLCRKVVYANGCEDVVEVIESRIEDVVLPSGTKADVIVSEWMGYFLLYESMLESVLFARDRWLRPHGILLPSRARLFLCPFSDRHWRSLRADMLRDVCGIDVSALVDNLAIEEATEPVIQGLDSEQLVGEPQCVAEFDLASVSVEDAFNKHVTVQWRGSECVPIHGFVGWFDVIFDPPTWSPEILLRTEPLQSRFCRADPAKSEANLAIEGLSDRTTESSRCFAVQRLAAHVGQVILSTAPGRPRTSWHQTLFYLPPVSVVLSHAHVLFADVVWKRSSLNRRFLEVCINSRICPGDAASVQIGVEAEEAVVVECQDKVDVAPAQCGEKRDEDAKEDETDLSWEVGQRDQGTMVHHPSCRSSVCSSPGKIAHGQSGEREVRVSRSWLLRSYAREGARGPPLPVARLRGTSRAAFYGGAL
eukprot:TRINITY_DN44575_c0_g1_i1.p1 TRINITY_DN44575_c0_g1~~TRINITY_DN44575_c0_g1_i1.p1  ORF type:complete len:559 (+),score=69.73 TRINITY_DN44575_c0_g1_i1:76-1677(+)